MESLASSLEFVYGNFELVLDEYNEIASERVQQILEVLSTERHNYSVLKENKLSDTSCDPGEPKKENIDPVPEPDTKEQMPAVKANDVRFKKLTNDKLVEIEMNQYSAATRRNTQLGSRVFNCTHPSIRPVKTGPYIFFSK